MALSAAVSCSQGASFQSSCAATSAAWATKARLSSSSDGASIGPTTSLGGPYPDGDIRHEYTTAAEVAPYISVEYGGEVSVDGGAWTTIPSTATVDGPAVPLQVLTSQNRLYTN